MKRRVMMIAVSLLLLWSVSALAEIPHEISYQGRVTDALGNPVPNGTYTFKFSIYNSYSILLWTEQQGLVVTDGMASATVGALTAIPDSVFDGSDRYLGISINHQAEMTPRTHLISVPYAFRAGSVDGDIITAPGQLYIDDGYGGQAISLSRGIAKNQFIMNFNATFPYNPQPAFKMEANGLVGASFRLFHPGGEVMGVEPSPFHDGYLFTMREPDSTAGRNLLQMRTTFGEGGRGAIAFFDSQNDSSVITPTDMRFFSGAERHVTLGYLGLELRSICETGSKAGAGKVLVVNDCGVNMVDTTGDTIMITGEDGTYYVSSTKAGRDAYYSRTGLKVSMGASDGYVMTSDSAGVGTWRPTGKSPVAYGYINSNGTIAAAYRITSCVWVPTSSRYEITIQGEPYFYSNYSTVVTPSSGVPILATTSSTSGRLIVYLYDMAGNKIQNAFQFVTYKM